MVCILSTEKRNQNVALDILQVTALLMEKNVSSHVMCMTVIAGMIMQKIVHPSALGTCCSCGRHSLMTDHNRVK